MTLRVNVGVSSKTTIEPTPAADQVKQGKRGTDELVNYEFAKVRRLYNKLGIGDRTEIEPFDGPHQRTFK